MYSDVFAGIMNRTKSTLGAKKLREWFRSPSRDRKLITQRQDIIEFLLKPRNSDLFARLTQCIKASKNLPEYSLHMSAHNSIQSHFQIDSKPEFLAKIIVPTPIYQLLRHIIS
ncbi:hypothetical protein SARC_10605 [Sphaeroforma arctica JP610]|uniref:DNA mismatch repair protein MutS core domain-containing protein n=1 Tax=Sphaeroforma arctica JP610 TaxID=667725 RepID=A0A0L0FJF8_9EUKA|nr:hypothetical protein SARC_10605 [Sphaeroforma arctica JP610]KNC76922.1 hypothetical protein SARC_10605 [Sphaeroforma arctica JP610]|eukprot:XP_014150824.1 hypothetical protein SARC_10605 [Sphaeroforma arctica JP610]